MWLEITIKHNNRNMQALWNTNSDTLIREFDVPGQLIVERNFPGCKPMYIVGSFKKMKEQLIPDAKKELKKFLTEETNVTKVAPNLGDVAERYSLPINEGLLPRIETLQPAMDKFETKYTPKQVLTPNDVTSETVKAAAAKIPKLKKDKGEAV
jgi:hypothetical protein